MTCQLSFLCRGSELHAKAVPGRDTTKVPSILDWQQRDQPRQPSRVRTLLPNLVDSNGSRDPANQRQSQRQASSNLKQLANSASQTNPRWLRSSLARIGPQAKNFERYNSSLISETHGVPSGAPFFVGVGLGASPQTPGI